MNLYEICEILYNCVDEETGEVLDVERVNFWAVQYEMKIEQLALWIKNMKAESKAIDDEIKSLQARKKALDNRTESIKEYIGNALRGGRFKTPKVDISFRKSTSVEVEDVLKLDEEFIRYSTPTANKIAIKNAIKNGTTVPGATLVENYSVVIK